MLNCLASDQAQIAQSVLIQSVQYAQAEHTPSQETPEEVTEETPEEAPEEAPAQASM